MARPLFYLTDHVFEDLACEEDQVAGVGGTLLFEPEATTPEQWLESASSADAVITCHAVLPGDFIERLERCRVIARYGVGIDNVDVAAATRAGIPVTHVPDYCVDEVSTHTLALLLALNRGIARLDRSTRAGHWRVSDAGNVHRIRGQVLGLVGFGRNAQSVAQKAAAFGMRIVAHDPMVPAETMAQLGVERADLDHVLTEADYVSLHAPLVAQTHHMIGAAAFAAMKDSAFLINTARGGLVDTEALRDALQQGTIAGAALDVFEDEPPAVDLAFDNVIVTPHSAFASAESVDELKRLTFARAIEVLNGNRPAVIANPEVWDGRRVQ